MIDDKFLNEYESILHNVERPSRYIGDEFGSYNKDFNKSLCRILLAFPDKYEIGISNFGHKILYDVINKNENYLCDRLYAPDIDFVELLKKNNKCLYGLETKRLANEFDIIAFGIQYEMCYTTILKMLELSLIPIKSSERKNEDPLIIAGGPCVSNPSVMSKFIDVFLIGDGEDLILEVIELKNKLRACTRNELLKELSNIDGVYCPKYPKKTTKRVAELTFDNHPINSPIPHFTSIHDRAIVELRRGCARLCRFCQASHINLPVRERSKEDIVELAKIYTKNTGYDEYSLLSLSSNDHSQIEDILKDLSCHFRGSGINVSLPSQRADKFSLEIAQLAQSERKATVTIAPEAGTQRMRNIINKNLSQEQIVNATISCIKNGWTKIKYYFVIGLPFEEYSDLEGIVKLIEDVNLVCREHGIKYPQITCSISIFVPKPHTPFQWARQNTLQEVNDKIKFLRDLKEEKKLKNVKFNFHNPKMSQLEAFYSRGDQKLSQFVYELYKSGSYLEAWDENLDLNLYNNIAQKLNIDVELLASKEFSFNDSLPWDDINFGVNKEWLFNEYQKAKDAISTIPCEVKCNNCGVCANLKTKKIIAG